MRHLKVHTPISYDLFLKTPLSFYPNHTYIKKWDRGNPLWGIYTHHLKPHPFLFFCLHFNIFLEETNTLIYSFPQLMLLQPNSWNLGKPVSSGSPICFVEIAGCEFVVKVSMIVVATPFKMATLKTRSTWMGSTMTTSTIM